MQAVPTLSDDPMNRGRLAADMNMMVVHDGKERDRHQWERLLSRCGFMLARIFETRSVMSVVEARPAPSWTVQAQVPAAGAN